MTIECDDATELHPNRLTTPTACIMFTTAGHALLTLKSATSGDHYTYSVTQALNEREEPIARWFVGVRNGEEFVYAGVLERVPESSRPDLDGPPWQFRLTRKSRLTDDAKVIRAFRYYVGHVINNKRIPSSLEVWHEGRCGMCGRPLTRPDSIALGIGPICAGKMGIGETRA